MRIKARLIILFIVVSLISLLPVAGFAYYYVSHTTKQNLDKNMEATAQGIVTNLDGWVNKNVKVVETIQLVLNDAVKQSDITVDYLKALKANSNSKDISDIYVGFENGKFIDGAGWVPDSDFDPRQRPWYQSVKESKALTVTDPYLDSVTNQYAVSIGLPLTDKSGNFIGVIAEDILLSTITGTVKQINLNGQGFGFLIDKNGVILAHPKKELVNTNVKENAEFSKLYEQMKSKDSNTIEYNHNKSDKILMLKKIPSTEWYLCVNVENKLAYKEVDSIIFLLLAMSLITFALIIGIASLLSRSLSSPLVKITEMFKKAELGDFSNDIPDKIKYRKDEIGMLSLSYSKVIENMQQQSENAKRIAQGDLGFEITEKSEKDELSLSMKEMMRSLRELVSDSETLVEAAACGNLQVRADISKH
ncbi:MAG: hypothetical protein K0Q85_1434, partial [Caproiciproducens sp.]|nr:hypothetical protein [Caproiciproducens sp.]